MSGAMEEAMRAWERGLSSVPDKVVCSSHIDDYAIRLFIKRNGQNDKCDYCGKRRVVVELESLMEFLTDALLHFYTDPANFMPYASAEGGYLGEVQGPWEMLESLGLEIDHDELFDDVSNSLDHTSAWSDEGVSRSDFKYEGWTYFKNFIRHQSRYLFSRLETFRLGDVKISAEKFLQELASDIRNQRMVTTIKAGTPIYRCRQHSTSTEVQEAKDICSPPVEYAIYANRMSAAGISMFYGAFDLNTAQSETLIRSDLSRPYFTLAEFGPLQDLQVIDLSKLPYVSPFDQSRWELYDRIEFLNKFLEDFTKPIMRDGKEHVDYIPTQVVTEFLRDKFHRRNEHRIDGIIYPSSKNSRENACVLFMNHYESLKRLKLLSDLTTIKIIP